MEVPYESSDAKKRLLLVVQLVVVVMRWLHESCT